MPPTIRRATEQDAPQWLDLLQAVLGSDYPNKEIYDPVWVGLELDVQAGHETWVAEVDGKINGSFTFLKARSEEGNVVANVGRNFFRPEAYADGSADMLVRKLNEITTERKQMAVVRVPISDNSQQILFEKLDYGCAGFQPFKHMVQARLGVLFYVHAAHQILVTRLPLSESLPQTSELAAAVLEKLKISTTTMAVRDGVTGYPLQTELKVHDATFEDFELWRTQSQTANPPVEISGGFNWGFGMMRIESSNAFRAVLGQRDNNIVAGLAYYHDDADRCVRLVDAFSNDDLSMGALLQQTLKMVQQQFSAVYVEIDILSTAPRLLKSAEQLGFVPVAYLPAFYSKAGSNSDVVKLVKLNIGYALEAGELTQQARAIVSVVDRYFQDQKVGVAIINLLRGLPIFEGLGDGELRKIARLFTQKLFRPSERIFKKGDSGDEAYVVMRGQIDIQLEEDSKPVASITNGKIFGELAFLDGAPRNAFAVANQASILLVVHRNALNARVQREPHLGMVVMRNVAMDLSNKLRAANMALAAARK